MEIYENKQELLNDVSPRISITSSGVEVIDQAGLRDELIDRLVYTFVFTSDEKMKVNCHWLIMETARALSIIPASIQDLYAARGRKEYGKITVPAINLRGMTFDMARAVVAAAIKNEVGAFIFELARSEMEYTSQPPWEYASVVTAAAIKEGFREPLFIQGDHFQVKAKKYFQDREAETEALKQLIGDALQAQFYNIDIDSSTMVDLEKPSIPEQQRLNFELCAELSRFIRELQPEGITVSIGGEIGEVGGKNSTEEELRAYLDGYRELMGEELGLSKISIQTGTSHGGVVLPDGSIAQVKIDFDTLKRLSHVAIDEYGMGGAVQHGASTLPSEAFHKFPENDTLEVHLATEFQNMVYDSELFPSELREEIYDYLREEHADEQKKDQTDEQFIYKTRKKAWGPFKKSVWDLPPEIRKRLREKLFQKFEFLFQQLNAVNTRKLVKEKISPVPVHKPVPEGLI